MWQTLQIMTRKLGGHEALQAMAHFRPYYQLQRSSWVSVQQAGRLLYNSNTEMGQARASCMSISIQLDENGHGHTWANSMSNVCDIL